MNNSQSKQRSKDDFKNKNQYKSHKRAIKNKLIFLVGLHVFLIFCFCVLTCTKYLTESKSQLFMNMLSDGLYLMYFVLVLFSVKYKIRYLMILSIISLAVTLGLKVEICVILSLDAHKINYVSAFDVLFVLLNSIVPWRFLILWNQLKQRKWRETFDLRFKMNSHLLQDQIKVQNQTFQQKQ